MKLPFNIVLTILIIFASCSRKEQKPCKTEERFTSELLELKEYFKIPGLAVSIEENGQPIYKKYFGVSDIKTSTKLEASTLFPIASITKVYSAVLILKLVEQGKLSLDDSINTYLSKSILNDSIKVKHVLSHTSQGNIGKEFYYSSRFGLLTKVIEQASGTSFAEAMKKEIFLPLQLKNTFLLKDSTQIERIAKPYILDNDVANGFIDYGYSSSAGIVSNLHDLSVFNNAIDKNTIITKESKNLMFSSFDKALPYGYGIFNQQFENLDIVWAYGQYDCYSSLLLKIPAQNISLTILANNNLLSDPARLIYGDVTSSLFAMSFLKNYIFKLDKMNLFEKPDSISRNENSHKSFYRKKLLAQALAESYMARFDAEKIQSSSQLLKSVLSENPDYLEYADLTLLHNLTFLKDVAFYRELGEFSDFDIQIESIGKMLLEKDPHNPYANLYLGTFYARKGNKELAKYYFERIVYAANFSKSWYTNEAQQWLNEN